MFLSLKLTKEIHLNGYLETRAVLTLNWIRDIRIKYYLNIDTVTTQIEIPNLSIQQSSGDLAHNTYMLFNSMN